MGPAVLKDIAMATNFRTQFATTGFVGYNFACMIASNMLFMVALCNRADHYIFILFLSSSSFFLLSFFSSPNLSSRRLHVYHTLAHGVVLV